MNNKSAIVLLGIYLLIFAGWVILNPVYFWDIVPYVATTLMIEVDDPVGLHAATFDLLDQRLDPGQFSRITTGFYVGDLYQNPIELVNQLDMYLNKPLYVLSLRLLYLVGISPVDGLLVMALLPAIGILILLFAWLRRKIHPIHAVIVVIIFSSAARLTDLTQGLVHNNFSSFFMFAAMYALIEKQRTPLATILFGLAMLTRTDNIFFVGLVQVALCWQYYVLSGTRLSRELSWRIGGLLASIAIYFAISTTYDLQWWRLFYHTIVESQLDILNFSVPFSMSTYLEAVGNGVFMLFSNGVYLISVLPLFVLMLLVTTPAERWRYCLTDLRTASNPMTPFNLVFLTLIVFVIYLFLFPSVPAWDRLFSHFYALITVCAASFIADRAKDNTGLKAA